MLNKKISAAGDILTRYKFIDAAGRHFEIQVKPEPRRYQGQWWYTFYCRFVGNDAEMLTYTPFSQKPVPRWFVLTTAGRGFRRRASTLLVEANCPELLDLIRWLYQRHHVETDRMLGEVEQVEEVGEEDEVALIWMPPVENK